MFTSPLITQARAIPCSEWYRIDYLIEKSADPEEREALHVIRGIKYRQDESQ